MSRGVRALHLTTHTPRIAPLAVCAINDYRLDPMRRKEGGEERINCDFVHVLIRGFPATIVVARKAIPEGAELLIDYGPKYWERVNLEASLSPAIAYAQQPRFQNARRQIEEILKHVVV